MYIRQNSNREVRIELNTVEECTEFMTTLDSKSDLYKVVSEMRIRHAEIKVYEYKFLAWLENGGADKIVEYCNADADAAFKWEQLVMQELRMWVCIGEPVTNSDIDYFVDRRGFTDEMRKFMLACLIAIGLYKETDTTEVSDVWPGKAFPDQPTCIVAPDDLGVVSIDPIGGQNFYGESQ